MTKKHDSKSYLSNFSKEMDDALVASCKKGSPQALTLYYKVRGLLVEKTEVREVNVVTADEHYAIAEAAKKKILRQEMTNFDKVNEGIDFSKWPLPPVK